MSLTDHFRKGERPKVPPQSDHTTQTQPSSPVLAARAVTEAERREPPSDVIYERAKVRMHETAQKRYQRHKSLLRGTLIKVFTEIMTPEHWADIDDAMLDQATLWLTGLQNRAGTNAEVSVATHASTLKPSEVMVDQPEPEPDQQNEGGDSNNSSSGE